MVAMSGRGWRLAPSLSVLHEQLDAAFPDRPTAADGTIGDAAHQATGSYHNPRGGLVLATDISDWPGGRWDPDDWARTHATRDPRVTQLISDGRIWTRERAAEGWRPYTGRNPHQGHLHITVRADGSTAPWAGISPTPTPTSATPATPNPSEEDDMFSILRTDDGGMWKVTTTHVIRYQTPSAVDIDVTLSRFAGRPVGVTRVTAADLDKLKAGRIVHTG